MTRLIFTSDTHGRHDQVAVPDGDILIHSGDFSGNGQDFLKWFSWYPHKTKIFICGNHDGMAQKIPLAWKNYLERHPSVTYLEDSGIEVQGLKFWGAPWTPEFFNWHFMAKRGPEMKVHWDRIPGDTDVLITHGPPSGILDVSGYRVLGQRESCGCGDLLSAVMAVQPKVHCFGHIHHSYGAKKLEHPSGRVTQFINASCCNEVYDPVNKPFILDL